MSIPNIIRDSVISPLPHVSSITPPVSCTLQAGKPCEETIKTTFLWTISSAKSCHDIESWQSVWWTCCFIKRKEVGFLLHKHKDDGVHKNFIIISFISTVQPSENELEGLKKDLFEPLISSSYSRSSPRTEKIDRDFFWIQKNPFQRYRSFIAIILKCQFLNSVF